MPMHAQTPPQGTESTKIGFIAPILKFPSAKISKTINVCYLNIVQPMSYQGKNEWYKY